MRGRQRREPEMPGSRHRSARTALVAGAILIAGACAGGSGPAPTSGASPQPSVGTGVSIPAGSTVTGTAPTGSNPAGSDPSDLPDGYAGHRSAVYSEGRHWLCHSDVADVTLNGDPTDIRDRQFSGGLPANWGLHLADVNLAMGNLVALATSQAEAFAP